jgi:tetratricopeptide (TPR) repeat protein
MSIRQAILLFSTFTFGVATACAQARPQSEQGQPRQGEPKFEVTVSGATGKKAERQLKEAERLNELRGKFTEEIQKCRSLLRARTLEVAETSCQSAARLADQLGPYSLERSGAYEAVGHVMLERRRYREALDYYSRALEYGQPVLTETSAELARLYGNLAMTNHLLDELDKAREFYRKSEQTYQAAYVKFGEGGADDEWVRNVRESYLKSLKTLLGYHRQAAEEAGAAAEVEEVEKLLNSLP